MRTNIVFHNCVKTDIAQIRERWAAWEAHLDELMATGSGGSEETPLDLHVRCEQKNRFAVRAVLPLPSVTLTAEALDENVLMALDRVVELLDHALPQHGGTPSYDELIDEVEEASAASFPASDAPAWTHVSISSRS